jgi:hypothetical protein
MASLIEIIINADDRASKKFDQVSRNARRMQLIIAAITLAAAGLTPALLGGLGAIAALFGTAGLAAAGFGALAATTIMKTVNTAKELEEAQLKANAALIAGDTKGYAKQMALVQAIMEGMTEEEKKAVVAINALKESWRDLENKMAPTTLETIAQSTTFMRLTMEKLFPSFQGVGDSFNKMIAWMNKAITEGKADAFFEHMNTFSVPMFEKVMISAGNILKGFAGLMVSFTPLGMDFGNGMVDMTDKFAKWAWGLQSSPAFADFCAMVKTNTPIIFGLLGTIVDVIWQIILKLNPLVMKIFEAANSFLQWSMDSGALDAVLKIINATLGFLIDNANWLVPILAAVWLGFKTLMGIATLVTTVQNIVEKIKFLNEVLGISRGVMALCRTAMLLFNGALWASPITWVVAAIVALIAIGVALYMNWDTVKAKAIELWNWMKKTWSDISKSVGDSYNKMVADASKWWSDTKQKWSDMYNDAKKYVTDMKDSVVNSYNDMINQAKQKLSDLWNGAKKWWSDIKSDAYNKAQEMKNDVSNKYNELKSAAINKLSEMVSSAQQKWNDMVNTARNKAGDMLSAGRDLGQKAVDGVKNGLSWLNNAVGTSLSNCWDYIKSWGSSFLSSGKGLMSSFVDGIKSGISKAVNAVSEGMSKVRSYLPFSPAKKGPLSDLDKSGQAFFPTWYNAALTQVKSMQGKVGTAFAGVANQANVALAGTGLEAFTGGNSTVTVRHVVEVDGTVGVDGSGLDDYANAVTEKVTGQVTGSGQFGTLNRQAIYRA